jgi:hypothetical protein
MQQAEVGGAAPQTPAQILPGAAAQPKAEWELELEAQEQAASSSGQQTDQAAPEASDGTTQPSPQADTPGVPSEPVAGDEPGDASHPRETDRQDAAIPAK